MVLSEMQIVKTSRQTIEYLQGTQDFDFAFEKIQAKRGTQKIEK